MNNYLLNDLINITISYMNTESYKKLKKIYPQEFNDIKTDELNLIGNISYKSLIDILKTYENFKSCIETLFPLNKIEPCEKMLDSHSTTFINEIGDKIKGYKNIFISSGLFQNIILKIRDDKNLTLKYYDLFNKDEMRSERMLKIREKILKNESNIYETTYPYNYIDIIVKYVIEQINLSLD
jgi:nitrate reductase alpha subunit